MPERRKLKEYELRKLRLYERLMSTEQSWYLAYGTIFVTTESIGLGFAFSLRSLGKTEQLWIVGIIGIAIGAILLFLAYISARHMDRWADKILKLTKSTDIADDFKQWQPCWYPWKWRARNGMRLVWMVPLLILLVLAWYYVAC